MATKKETKSLKGLKSFSNEMTRLNKLSKSLLNSASNSDTSRRDDNLNRYMDEIDDIINADFKRMSIYSSEDLSKFLVDFMKTDKENSPTSFNINNIEDIFENDSNGLMQQFQNRFESELLLLEDLNMISSQFYELQEAIDITRDSILTADDHSNTISRELEFITKTAGDESTSYVSITESMEREHKLLNKIKSHIVPNTLKYGRYYVYTVPYSYVYTKFANKQSAGQISKENYSYIGEPLETSESVAESFVKEYIESAPFDTKKVSAKMKKDAKDTILEYMKAITIDNEDVSIPVLENAAEVQALMDMETIKSMNKASRVKKDSNYGVDAVYDPSKIKASEFADVTGCYIKLIDPRKMIPVKVLEQTIGYYYLHEEPVTRNRTPFSSVFGKDLTNGYSKKEDDFIDKLSDKIVRSFNKPFLEKNHKFKRSIAAALSHNDISKKNIKFQFIPAEYITEYKVNENENDEGTSMLSGSLFYAKLYLALLLFNMVTIISKSNDQRLYYISNSGVDKNIANKVQSAARQIKAREMNYSDLFNYKSMVSKVGAGRDAFIPTGVDDRRAISFDILAGQDVELHNEFMNTLKSSAINSTGVPAVIMNYVNEADYAKSIVMGNLRFLARTISYQVDINDSTTELYKKVMKYSTTLDDDVINGFRFKLSKPRSLDATNMVELINNSDALAKFIVETLSGENSNPDDLENKAKDMTVKKIVKKITSMLGWTQFEELYDESILEAKKILEEQKARSSEDSQE